MTCSQMPGNLFPSHKLKGNCTFATRAVTIGNDEVEEDSSAKEKEKWKPSAGEDVETSGRVGGMGQATEYIIHFAKAVELYQKKNRNYFVCGSPDHLIWDCPKDISKFAWKMYLNMKEGMARKGGQAPQKSAAAQQTSQIRGPEHKDITKDSILESRPTCLLV